jgi:hypothetical protein
MSKIVLFLICVIVGIIWFVLDNRESKKYDAKYFDGLKLKLKGEVLSVKTPRGFNGFGIIKVKILTSNVKKHDPRNNFRYYYCIIQDSLAEVYQLSSKSCSPGDIVDIDTDRRIFTLYKANGEKFSWEIVLNKSDFFLKYLQKRKEFAD